MGSRSGRLNSDRDRRARPAARDRGPPAQPLGRRRRANRLELRDALRRPNGTQRRTEADFNMRDAIVMGLTQCLALIPGVSRSGATITAGLLRGSTG